MAQESAREQPIISFTFGPTGLRLIDALENAAKEMLRWRNINAYKPPELVLSTVAAYKVALLYELVFTRQVGTYDLSQKLAKTNPAGLINGPNFQQACEEVAALVAEIDPKLVP